MVRERVSAIVLAGGRSTRFGADKLAARVGGETLLDRAVEAVAGVADEVIVVKAAVEGPVAVGGGPTRATSAVADADHRHALRAEVRVVRDTTPGIGPLAGLRDGAAAAAGTRLLVVAGDMPTLRPDVLRLLLATLEQEPEVEAAILSPAPAPAPAPAPPVRPLPMALRRSPALDAATRLLAADRRSLRGLFDVLRTTPIPAATWLALDPEAATFRDIDTPADLAALDDDP